MLYSGHRSQLTHLAVVERLGEPDLGVILEQVRIALDALRDRGGGGVGHRVVEQSVEVNVVHALGSG